MGRIVPFPRNLENASADRLCSAELSEDESMPKEGCEDEVKEAEKAVSRSDLFGYNPETVDCP
jgi:hypothetical protein